jgi:AraC-like DNA-binding protein
MKKLLIIENRPLIRSNLVSELDKEFELNVIDSTIKTIDYLMYSNPDLIILGMDFKLPLDTLNYVLYITKAIEKKNIPILVVGHENEYNRIKQVLYNGATDFIFFPFINNKLLRRVNSMLPTSMVSASKEFEYKSYTFHHKMDSVLDKFIFTNKLSLQEMSNEMLMSISTLNRKCKSVYNDTPSNLLLEKKLKASIQILLTNESSIKNVSSQLGFKSVQHFCLCFKKKYNNSPKRYVQELLVKDSQTLHI